MNGPIVVACWIVGGTLAGLVLYRGFHAGWWTITKKPRIDVRVDPEWRMDSERERLKAAAIWRGYRKHD